ncbi:amino acid transporter [Acinetobacter qingfengensis]|uniref:Amino acid transporter n=1 Tax=Acinetobacter qingfengensis TaxID=1262585 RepID=A0A1E7RCN0_9GAMM|nr:LysE/ArgO family amino acid transporter [Acinetobacter qingfengensis]KAA8734949.1 amino acid transporter [Acinetobacter qingfengensis]OEY97036.1 amino acid transporter [Acinetobacter qingfengensis]
MATWLYGLATGFSLIIAIGAQNVFVLKQGLKKQHVFWICLICAMSDSLLIFCGVWGFGEIIVQYPVIVDLAKYFGALFLFLYGLKHCMGVFNTQKALIHHELEPKSLLHIAMICLALTWLNPHVYLDTVVLVGAISVKFMQERYLFALGVILASWIFFFSLGYGARFLLPIFQNAQSWKILDGCIAIIMWCIAYQLIH